jgi:predicted TPR repeat methyltransferase
MTRAPVGRARHKRHATSVDQVVVAMLRQAIEEHRIGQLDAAEALYRRTLQMQAGQPDALHFLGVLCHQRGRSDEGIRLIRMALRAVPLHADAHNNLGNILKETGKLVEAEACYRRALTRHGQHQDALGNLALVLEAQQRFQDAFEAYAELLKQVPQLSLAHYLMGMYLCRHVNETEDLEQAVACFRNAIRCDGSNVRALDALGVTLYVLGRQNEAVDAYRGWLDREPDNPVPRHMLAACGGEAAPPRADDAYVREVFDRFADSFDEQLLKNLDYRAPQVLVDVLTGVLGTADGALDVLDAGCGTGLCGPLIRAHARRLDGVDLSGGMLEKARLRGGYDRLVTAELTAYLQDHPETWDVVLSADTLVYFGDLEEVLAATHEALRAGGRVAFTLEAMEADEVGARLSSSGRYRHARDYVERVLDAAGFVEVSIAASALRKEVGQPVNGWVVLARKRQSGG